MGAILIVGWLTSGAMAQEVAPTPSRPASSAAVANSRERTPIVRRTDESSATNAPHARTSPWGTLAILGGLIAALYTGSRWLKHAAPERFSRVTPAAIDLLGSTPITPQAVMHVVRVGDRLLIVGSGNDGLRTLTEIHDPAEVAHLTHLCRAEQAAGPANWNLLSLLSRRAPRMAENSEQLPQPSAVDSPPDASRANLSSPHAEPRFQTLPRRVAGCLIAVLVGATTVQAQPWPRSTPVVAETAPAPNKLNAQRTPLRTFAGDAAIPGADARRLASDPLDHAALESPRVTGGSIQLTAYDPEVKTPRDAESPPALGDSNAGFTTSAPASPSLLDFATPQGLGGTLRLGMLVGVMSLAPAILLMTTCYVRFIVVFGLLRQAIGVQQFPPTQVLTALSLFLTGLVMWPTWSRCWREGVAPYAAAGEAASPHDFQQALTRTAAPVRGYMSRQIEAGGNTDAIDLLMSYQSGGAESTAPPPAYYDEVPLQVLLPAFVLSELKTAFLIGFQIYLPFVVIDLVVTSLLASLGLGTLSPAVVSLPFKLLLFVLIDGWFLVVELLLQGLAPMS